eukprot:7384245-Prymnesium_polylepis.1
MGCPATRASTAHKADPSRRQLFHSKFSEGPSLSAGVRALSPRAAAHEAGVETSTLHDAWTKASDEGHTYVPSRCTTCAVTKASALFNAHTAWPKGRV